MTGFWVINPDHIHEGMVFALHEEKAAVSYLQGTVVRVTEVVPRNKDCPYRRVQMLVRETSTSLPWRGPGAGERGYVWV